MLKHRIPFLLLEPAVAEVGAGEAVEGSAQLPPDKSLPDNLKGLEFSLDDVGEPPEADFNEGKENKAVGGEKKEFSEKSLEPPKVGEKKQEEKAPEPKKEIKQGLNIPQDKKEEEKVEVEQKKEEQRPAGKEKVESRDYSVFPQELHEVLKKTSNEAFNFIQKTYEESKQIKEEHAKIKAEWDESVKLGFPRDWVNHPQAYTLTPQYQKLSSEEGYIKFEREFYKKQYSAIRQGESYQELLGYRDGKPEFSQALKANPDAESEMLASFNAASQRLDNLATTKANIQHTFQARYNTDKGFVDKVVDEQWGWFNKDPKHAGHKYVQDILKVVPESFRNHPSTLMAALMYASLNMAMAKNQELEAKLNKQVVMKKEESKQEENVASPSSVVKGSSNLVKIVPKGAKYQPPSNFELEDM